METVFTHNATEEELINIFGTSDRSRFEWFDQEDSYNAIAYLFYYRGDKKKAEEYANKLPPNRRNDFWRTVEHP